MTGNITRWGIKFEAGHPGGIRDIVGAFERLKTILAKDSKRKADDA